VGGDAAVSRVGLVIASTLLLVGLGGCTMDRAGPIRIGVLTNCGVLWSPFSESMVAAAELPLLARGGRLKGETPADGVSGLSIDGRRIELLRGCSDGTASGVLREARRLVETEGADVLIGAFTASEGLALRAYAHRRPETTFAIVGNLQTTTLHDPALNVFRFSSDAAQWTAGLGSYAFDDLGWRTAAVVGDRNGFGYAQAAGFVAEFCSLGGHVTTHVWIPPATEDATPFVEQVPKTVDGVAVVGGLAIVGFLERYDAPAEFDRHVVIGGGGLADQTVADALHDRAEGLVSTGPQPSDLATRGWKDYVLRAREAFPDIPFTTHPFSVQYFLPMEAVLEALETTTGDLSNRQSRFRRALAHIALDAPAGRVTLDANRQAIAPNFVMQLQKGPDGKLVQRTIRTVEGVEQSFGGRFRKSGKPVGRDGLTCARGNPPPWAKGITSREQRSTR
jgi:branched-chain amino acid transport system substrate-binding protein